MNLSPDPRVSVPNKRYRIIFRHGIGAPDYEMAYSMLEQIVKQYLGGETKFAAKAWDRLSCAFDVEEESGALSEGDRGTGRVGTDRGGLPSGHSQPPLNAGAKVSPSESAPRKDEEALRPLAQRIHRPPPHKRIDESITDEARP